MATRLEGRRHATGHVSQGRIWCGTPAGVGPVKPGDQLEGGIEGLEVPRITMARAQRAG